MSLPRYLEYRDSGVEWLGEVPGHWSLPKLKHFASFAGGGTPSRDNLTFWNGDIPWVSPKDMKVEFIESAEECITDVGLNSSSSSLVQPGRALMVVRSGILKHTIPVAINRVEVALNQDMKAISFAEECCDSQFFMRWVQGLNDVLLLAWAKQGATVESIEHSYLAETIIPLPPVAEQTAISTFLDRETAKIDGLIAEQEKLIALLAEKRQATISHAVTKGLNPAAPMKDSGVAWLGEVPAHWEAANLKRFAEVIDCKHHTVEFLDEGLPIVSIRELRNNRIDMSNAKLTSQVEWDFLREGRAPEYGDLVFCRNASVGAVAYVDVTEQPFCMGQDVCLIRPLTKSKFMHYQLTAPEITNQIESFLVGATIRRANVEEIRNLFVTWPAEEEQAAIANFLDTEFSRLDELTAEATRGIALLKERRSALISAAVTGKIDVRHLAEQKAA